MSSYPAVVDHASPRAAAPSSGMVVVRAAGLPFRPAVPAGTVVTFCYPVVTAPAVARGGRVLAGGWLPDSVRLGELERYLGEGVIEGLAAAAVADGRMPAPQRRRLMSFPLVIRLTVAMTLMPDASYCARSLIGY